ncbi:hypothetical protein F5146DRAFT_20243 [Armillaria mellea]|nr:hypothetical protein F5146DRAFT_20243 [Armillaria mellea]
MFALVLCTSEDKWHFLLSVPGMCLYIALSRSASISCCSFHFSIFPRGTVTLPLTLPSYHLVSYGFTVLIRCTCCRKHLMDPAIPPSPGSYTVYYELYQIGLIALALPIFQVPLASDCVLLFGLSWKGRCGDAKGLLGAFNLTCAPLPFFLLRCRNRLLTVRVIYIHFFASISTGI